MGAAVDVPLRFLAKDAPSLPNLHKATADQLAAEHRKRAQQRQQERDNLAKKQAKAKNAARLKREKEAKEREASRAKASASAATKARQMDKATEEMERQRRAADEAELRTWMRKVLEGEDEERRREATAQRMREKWRQWSAPSPRHWEPTDPFAEHRGELDDEEEEEEAEEALGGDATEEEVQQAAARKAKARERDQAARRILARSSRTLMEALGLHEEASDAEVDSTVRKLLRLLHPDYSINLALKGTRRHQRIEAAFKRLNGLRDDAEADGL